MAAFWRRSIVLSVAMVVIAPVGAPIDNVSISSKDGVAAKSPRLDRTVTRSISDNAFARADDEPRHIDALRSGLGALEARDVAAARAVRDTLPPNSLDRHVLSWAIAMRGGRDVPSAEIASTARQLPGWPGMDALRRNSERALRRENPSPKVVIAAFGATAPQTSDGATILARAHIAEGDIQAARSILGPYWRTAKLDAAEETAMLAEFGDVIAVADHRFRMERALYAEQPKAAERLAEVSGAVALQKAWAAVLRGDKSADKLLAAVPKEQRSAGFLFAEAKQFRKGKQFIKAAETMDQAAKQGSDLVDPSAWWVERRVLSRELMDQGNVKAAYQVAANHASTSKGDTVDAEFHAGWYALRGLKDATKASEHFARIAAVADGPISSSRANYWLGRAAEAGGPGDATAYFEKAASYGTAFYGQLAAQRLGRTTILLETPTVTDADRADFGRRESVRAIERLEEAGYPSLADRLYRDLADQLTSPGELSLLVDRVRQRGNHFLALRLSKAAVNRGIDVGSLSHPVGAIPAQADISGAGRALAYAVARQESEFNVGAVSGAGARGLLQLLPGTARDVAKRNGMEFSQSRLTTDAGYNATLGAAFLGEQLKRFDGSYILTFVGYNAGPRRAREWVEKYGDPRGQDIDSVVDWIERIPFTETRSYVQRVMENYQVYKEQITGKFDIVDDLVTGRS